MVTGRGEGSCDAQLFVAPPRTLASLSPAPPWRHQARSAIIDMELVRGAWCVVCGARVVVRDGGARWWCAVVVRGGGARW